VVGSTSVDQEAECDACVCRVWDEVLATGDVSPVCGVVVVGFKYAAAGQVGLGGGINVRGAREGYCRHQMAPRKNNNDDNDNDDDDNTSRVILGSGKQKKTRQGGSRGWWTRGWEEVGMNGHPT
jgi:hypothetical protein